jgi:hypothetical protein
MRRDKTVRFFFKIISRFVTRPDIYQDLVNPGGAAEVTENVAPFTENDTASLSPISLKTAISHPAPLKLRRTATVYGEWCHYKHCL